MPVLKENDYVGSYKILAKIGEGGMAAVYKALQPSLKRTVVIKNLKDPNREIITRFKNEAYLSASFHQENLAAIYDFIYSGRAYFLVMEYVDGEDLRTIIDYMAPLPPALAALITLDIARGLEYIHTRNIIHRDIKPGNILLSYGGDVKLIDFGIARDEISTRLTLTGMIVGTPAYMAPEQANDGTLNARSDLFSLGILLYEMLTGLKPFRGENNTEILSRITRGKYTAPHLINPEIPRALRRILKKTLRKNPKRRYRNATELINDLEKFIPWQLRSRKKELISRHIGQLDKNESSITSSNLKLAQHSGRRIGGFRVIKYALAAAIIYLGVVLFLQFKQNRIGHIRIELPNRYFTLQVDGRALTVGDGKTVVSAVQKGRHDITAGSQKSNYVYLSTLNVDASDTAVVTIPEFNKEKPAAIAITSEPAQAEVYLNDISLGVTPLSNLHLRGETLRLKIIKAGFKPLIRRLDLAAGKRYLLHYDLRE